MSATRAFFFDPRSLRHGGVAALRRHGGVTTMCRDMVYAA